MSASDDRYMPGLGMKLRAARSPIPIACVWMHLVGNLQRWLLRTRVSKRNLTSPFITHRCLSLQPLRSLHRGRAQISLLDIVVTCSSRSVEVAVCGARIPCLVIPQFIYHAVVTGVISRNRASEYVYSLLRLRPSIRRGSENGWRGFATLDGRTAIESIVDDDS